MKYNPVVHFEMPYGDANRVAMFYEKAFGWKMNKTAPEYGGYVTAATTETDEKRMVKTPGTINGGFYPNSPDVPGPKTPRVIVSVEDIAAAMKDVKAAGGKVIAEPVDIPMIGKWVNFTDSEGNPVGLLQAAPRQ
ncbi:MAG: VOC family protein [Candidatus Kerfeldbacteria bacterium]|nr:VOC family protein [Candidatus Kerfeldbacteria bacterium]